MKYIITNCPCYNKDYSCQSKDNITGKHCKDITDCLLKQIVDKCKMGVSDKTLYIILENKNRKDMWLNSSTEALLEILELLDIEECENAR